MSLVNLFGYMQMNVIGKSVWLCADEQMNLITVVTENIAAVSGQGVKQLLTLEHATLNIHHSLKANLA